VHGGVDRRSSIRCVPVLRLWCLCAVLVLLVVGTAGLPGVVAAQELHINATDVPLRTALDEVRQQAGINLVFADRLVEAAPRVSCRYRGTDAAAALACVLSGTNLQANETRTGQFVLVAVEKEGSEPPPLRASMAGFVTDAVSGEVLPGAHVYVATLERGTVTNEAGYFALPALPVGPYRARVSYVGYAPEDTVLTAGAPVALLALQPQEVQAEALQVDARRSERSDLAVLPGVVSTPTRELEQLPSFSGESDLFQALQWMPGIQRAGELTGGLVVRGGQSDHNLYLLDGAPVYHPWHAFNVVSTFQTETFKNMSLYRDAFPAEHGGRLSAVLDAEMRDGSQAALQGVAALSLLSGRVVLEGPLRDDLSFMVAARRSYIDQIAGSRHPVEQGGVRDTLRTGYFFYDLSAKTTYRPSTQHRLSLSYYGGGDNLDLRLPFDLSLDFSSWLRPADLFFELDHNWGNQLISARHQYLPSDRFFVTTTAYASGYRARERSLIRPSEVSTITSAYDVRLWDLGAKVDVDFYASLDHQVRTGLRVRRHLFDSTLDAELQRSPRAVETLEEVSQARAYELTAYAQDTWTPGPRWTIQPGVRFSYFSGGRHAHVRPRLNARYVALPGLLSVKAGGGLHVQYLHRLRDRSTFLYDLVSSRWIPSDEEVRPSTSRHVSAGLELQPLPWLRLGVEGYARMARHILIPRDELQRPAGLNGGGIDTGALLGQYAPGESRAYGLELLATADLGAWQLRATYHGGRSKSRSRGLGEESFRPTRFDVPRALRATVQRETDRWIWGLSTEWRNGYPTTVPEARFVLGDVLDDEPTRFLHRPAVNNGRLPTYWRTDLSLGYRFGMLGAPARVQLNLFNVFGRRNIVSRQYDPAPEAGVTVQNRRGFPLLPLFELHVEL